MNVPEALLQWLWAGVIWHAFKEVKGAGMSEIRKVEFCSSRHSDGDRLVNLVGDTSTAYKHGFDGTITLTESNARQLVTRLHELLGDDRTAENSRLRAENLRLRGDLTHVVQSRASIARDYGELRTTLRKVQAAMEGEK